jgi:hypothetical protein
LEVELSSRWVIDGHATLLEQRHLLGVGGSAFTKRALYRCHDALLARPCVAETRRTKK